MPYSSSIYASGSSDRPGLAHLQVNTGGSIWGYDTHPTVNWTNLNTGASGSVTGHGRVSLGDQTSVWFDIPTGAGQVRIDLSVVNTGFVPVPPVTCSGTTHVR
ncbi:hypothetical protein GV794_27085 [Nocardia cyriacigeorgica]|nr:hypothetical protein [Nocardia cyriacigeorgica]NEW38530.1 hypothetical protein [Nocardia cyriacigeorgica]NEW49557.1 hypothetical protein [Nocardia cyriacigeorgica]NEW59271.1 hypothetical protein [Nocardia cyriacigeorgica]